MELFEKTPKEMHIYVPCINEDTISRQWLLECLTARGLKFDTEKDENIFIHLVRDIAPPAQPEPLTDNEKRIFLAAMSREEKVCKEVDDAWRDRVHADDVNLVSICHEIIRKVKGALWN